LTGQDLPIVESQRPQLLPLEPEQEIHAPSDRASLAYRQFLKKVGLKHYAVNVVASGGIAQLHR
jgi:vanillate O-demethylase monooxygenase subunit